MIDRPQNLPYLVLSRKQVEKEIKEQIEDGQELHDEPVETLEEYDELNRDYRSWHKYSVEFLRRAFSDKSYADELSQSSLVGGYESGFSLDRAMFKLKTNIQDDIDGLASILDRIELIPVNDGIGGKSGNSINVLRDRQVFIVHGHDSAVKEKVARFITNLGLEPIILHEKANAGRTIIEKFEAYTGVAFAIVLMTPDDIGCRSGGADMQPRARQNVIFELGFFLGRLGRRHVCALYDEKVEMLSDYQGVLYLPLQKGWQLDLAREMKEAGLQFDMNKAI